MDYVGHYHAALEHFLTDKEGYERDHLEMIKQVHFVDIAHTVLDSSYIAQNIRKELGNHQIRIV
jgi:hypothetical protein